MSLSRVVLPGLLLLSAGLSGCSLFSANDDAFKSAQSNPPLDTPPGLVLPQRNSAYQVPKVGGSERSVSKTTGMEIKRDGQLQWIVVERPASQLWDALLGFWKQQNIRINDADRALGVIRTEWVETAAGAAAGGLRGMVNKAIGSNDSGIRNQYRMRVEPAGNSARVYLSHQSAVPSAASGEVPGWDLVQTDPALEAEMLARLRVYLVNN